MFAPRHLVLATTLVATLSGGPAGAGPCTGEIDRIEALFRALGSGFGHQSPSARPDRQPTPTTVARAQRDALADRERHRQALERAREADAGGDRAGCLRALDEARHRPSADER